MLLRAVRDRPGEPQREVGRRFGVTAGNVSMLITKLVSPACSPIRTGAVRSGATGAREVTSLNIMVTVPDGNASTSGVSRQAAVLI
jgi:hypothetical protein